MTHYYLLGGSYRFTDDEFDAESIAEAFEQVKARVLTDYDGSDGGITDRIYLGDVKQSATVVDGELKSIDTVIEIAMDIDGGEKVVYGHLMTRIKMY